MGKSKGVLLLESLTRNQALSLIESFSQKEIAEEYNISHANVSLVLTDIIKDGHRGRMTPVNMKRINFPPINNVPFSENEDDYGEGWENYKHIITKDGLLFFGSNKPLIKLPTMLEIAIRNYKQMLNKMYV